MSLSGAVFTAVLTRGKLAQQGVDVCLLEAKTVASGASGGLGRRGV